jgi:hypothetical protein
LSKSSPKELLASISQAGISTTDPDAWFILAMAHERLGHTSEARKWYEQAVQWTKKHRPTDPEMRSLMKEVVRSLEESGQATPKN